MANKKITELPFINTLTGSTVWDNPLYNTVVPVVLYGTTNQITVENFSKFMNLYTATTGSLGNTFVGPQTINNNVTVNGNQSVNGNVTINGTLRVTEVVAQYETASILFSTGSTKLGDQITDKHEFTGSTNITGSFIVNGANLTDFSASNSATFTNYSSSNAVYVTALSSSNSATFTNYSSSNSTVATNYSSSINSTILAVSSSINSTIISVSSSINTNIYAISSSIDDTLFAVSASIDDTLFAVSASIDTTILTISASIDDTLFAVSASIDTTILTISASIDDTLFAVSASIDTTIYTISASIDDTLFAVSASIDSTIKANLGATNDVVYRIQQATASIQEYTASLKTALLPNGTNLDVIGNFRVSGSTTLGDTNTDKVEVTGSVNVTGYVSASGINIYSTGTPEILSTNNLRLTADSSVVITTDNSGTAKVWDFDNGGTINLPGGATISTPNTVDVIVAAGSAGAAQLSNFNKSNYFAINDTLATINVDAGATNKVWQFTNVGSINLPGSIVKPDGGEYSASLTLTSSFHAFTASIGSTSNDYRIELNSIEAYTASLKSAAIVSSSTQVQNYDVFALNSNLYTGTGSLQAQLNGLMAFTASLDNTYATDVQLLPILQATRSLELLSGSLIGITNGLMAFTAALDSTYATDAQLYELYAATASLNIATGSIKDEIAGIGAYTASLKGQAIVSSSTQVQNYDLFALNSNLYESTGSIKAEIAGIEAYTASLKSAAIVSSSQQIKDYFTFAQTSSANTFYGTQTITGSLNVGVGTSDNTAGDLLVDTANKIVYVGRQSSTSGDNTIFAVRNRLNTVNALYVDAGGNGAVNITGSFEVSRGVKLGTATGNVEVVGNLVMTTAGNGIDFSANTGGAGKSSQLLDDYEEGIVAATVTCSTSGTVTLDSGYNSLSYVKIGSVVHLTGLLSVTSVSSPVGAFSVPLPFAVANLADAAGTSAATVHIDATNTANSSDFCAIVNETETALRVYLGNTTSLTSDSANQLKAGSSIYISVTYRTS